MTENEKYAEWVSRQPELKVGETYKLLHAPNTISKEGIWEMKVKNIKGNNCIMQFNDGSTTVMLKQMVLYKIYEAQKHVQ